MSYVRGPLATSVKVTRQNSAETSLSMAMRLAAMAAATQQASNGDCDGDGYIEPIPYRSAGAAPHPTGGGLVPLTIGAAKSDPWRRDFGYCVFDHGPKVDDATCGGPAQLRQKGANTGAFPALAMISAGPDGVFQTACLDWADTDLNGIPDLPPINTPAGSDDIVFSWTYLEAAGAAGGLWKLEAGDASTAEIDRNLSVKDGGGIERMAFDIAAKALSVGAGGSGSFPTVKADYLNALTAPAIEVLAPINATASYSVNGTEIIDDTGLIVSGEQDPEVGTVESGKWCSGGLGGVLTCEQEPPALGLGGAIYSSAREELSGRNYVDFAIPEGAERITVHILAMSETAGNLPAFQLGDSGGVEIIGYAGTASSLRSSAVTDTTLSNGFQVRTGNAARVVHGSITFALVDPDTNAYSASGQFGSSDASYQFFVAGSKSLSAPLESVRLTAGGAVFDSGYALATWE